MKSGVVIKRIEGIGSKEEKTLQLLQLRRRT
jgi:hypothetical protein